ncbi:uncharacterized protein [Chanodichthys erythropterus]|uniref:uncharacterized protein n=1 Tax=Chanodichthys erythropterus TaxID=933992 RepID=UPI00351F15C2
MHSRQVFEPVLIYITMDVFISQTSWKKPSGMANPGLTLVCCDVIAGVIHYKGLHLYSASIICALAVVDMCPSWRLRRNSCEDLSLTQGTKNNDLIKKSNLIKDGNPARYRLQTKTDNLNQSEPYRKMTFGERDKNKPHKIILMVGETGTGKTTLINVMINYMLGVQREDKVWFEITDDQKKLHQTSIITVYEFYPQESPIDLTIIDTPGYGGTHGIDKDKEIAESLLSLSTSEKEIHELHAVCLVIMAHQIRLSDRQIYIFDAVQSLFGRDIAENIVLLFTHSTGAPPKNALTAVKEAKIKCAENDKKKPVYFLFDNCQSEAADEDDDEDDTEREPRLNQSWDRSFKGMAQLFKFLDTIQPKSLKMTQEVLQKRKQLEANINNLQSHVQTTELKQNELKQTQEALEKNKKDVEENKNFEYEVEVPYKEKVDIDPFVASVAMCCTVCEENCHYPDCWWFTLLSWCSVMKNNHCTVCTNKCHYSKHVKEAKIYVTKTKKEKRTYEDLKKKYEGIIGKGVSLVKMLEEDLRELEKEKIKLVFDTFHCVEKLEMISLSADSLFTLLHIDFLIEKLKEINETDKAKTLEDIKKKAGEKHGSLGYIKKVPDSNTVSAQIRPTSGTCGMMIWATCGRNDGTWADRSCLPDLDHKQATKMPNIWQTGAVRPSAIIPATCGPDHHPACARCGPDLGRHSVAIWEQRYAGLEHQKGEYE